MNGYVAIGLLAAFVGWSGFMYHEGLSKESAVCGQADAKHDLAQSVATIAAEKGVITTIGQQQTVTQGVDNAYQTKKSDIDNQYAAAISMRPEGAATGNGVSTPAGATCRSDAAASRSFHTKVFKLSAKECDDNTAQLYGLQEWVMGQGAIMEPHER